MLMKNNYSNFRKNGLLILIGSFLFSISALAQPTAVIARTEVAPVIDGAIDDMWTDIEKNDLILPFTGETPTLGQEGETYWQALWGDDGIYILVVVNDDVYAPFYASEAPNEGYKYDKVEVYFDVNYDKLDGLGGKGDPGHYSYQPNPLEGQSGIELPQGDGGVMYAYQENNPDYSFEIFCPFSLLVDADGVILDKSEDIGFDVQVIDNDVLPEAERSRMVWSNTGTVNENWQNMDAAGLITLEGVTDVIYIESIVLEDGEITADNDTLTLIPVVTPVDASIQDFNWTLTNVTGRANINSKGQIIPIMDGTVTVQALAIDGSWAESNVATITISGQRTMLDEVSYIRNGDLLMEEDATGLPEFWKGSNLTEIADGIAVCVPTEIGNPWDYKLAQRVYVPVEEKDRNYNLYFKAWSDEVRVLSLNFEDANSETNYDRYGYSTDPEAIVSDDYTSPGESAWTFELSTEPTNYHFHVTFTDMTETTNQDFNFFIAEALGTVFIDSVFLVSDEDLGSIFTDIQARETSSMKVYPNPVGGSNVLNVVLSSPAMEEIAIYNVFGQKLIEIRSSQDYNSIDVSELAAGIYFVKTKDQSVKFVVQ